MDPSNPTNYQWKRPYFGYGNKIKIVVPNVTVLNMMKPAADAIKNAADDCIASTSMDVILKSEWDALQQQAHYMPIFVDHGPQNVVCGDLAEGYPEDAVVHGCGASPQPRSVLIGINLFQLRNVPGRHIGLNSEFVVPGQPWAASTPLHELMHTLGFSHTYDDSDKDRRPHLDIPGTAGRLSRFSIMRPGGEDYCEDVNTSEECVAVGFLSADDKRSIDVLYSSQPNSTCSPAIFETTCPIGCVQLYNDNGTSIAGDCCWCNGAVKHLVRSSWSPTTYICQ